MNNLFKLSLIAVFIGLTSAAAFASAVTEIEAANKAGKSVFLVVIDASVSETENAVSIANQAQKISPKSVVIKINRDDADNKKLIKKYQLESAQLPLILVIASNGIVTGCKSYETSAENLAALIPSPKKMDVLKSLYDGKFVFIIVSKSTMIEKQQVVNNCLKACAEMKGKADVIEVDIDDIRETAYLKEIQANQSDPISQPQIIVINTKGQITGTLNGIVDSKTLVATATKKTGGCCAPGSGKSCGH